MATHDISFEIPQKVVLAKDITFEVKSNNSKLGTLLISKGNIEWRPAHKVVRKYRLSWEKLARLMEEGGREIKS